MYAACAAALGLAVSAGSSSSSSSTASTTSSSGSNGCKLASQASTVAALPGYQVCLFIAATSKANHPDSVVYAGGKVWAVSQNTNAKDGLHTNPTPTAAHTSPPH